MITEQQILEALSQGKSIEEIANDFTSALNSAKTTYEATNIKEREKKEICADISLKVADYLALCGIKDKLVDPSEIQELLDLVVELENLLNAPKKEEEKELDNLLSNLINDILNSKN